MAEMESAAKVREKRTTGTLITATIVTPMRTTRKRQKSTRGLPLKQITPNNYCEGMTMTVSQRRKDEKGR